MWPFDRRRHQAPGPVIPNRLNDDPEVGAAAHALLDPTRAVEHTIQTIHTLSVRHIQELVTEAQSLAGTLDGLLPDLDTPGGSLNKFAGDVNAAYQRLKNTVGQSPDIILRRITVGRNIKHPALIAFADGMVDNEIVDPDTVRVTEL